jgi:hypothetical protein
VTSRKEDLVEDDRETAVPETEEEADVEAHRLLGVQAESDDDPEVEGHRLLPPGENRSEI